MPEMVPYKLYATVSSTTDAAATLDIAADGSIYAVSFACGGQGNDALNDGFAIELSFASVSGFGTNDTRASFAGCRSYQGFLTSGGGPTSVNMTVPDLHIPVAAGERLFMHISIQGTSSVIATAWIYVMDYGGPGRPSRRRRQT